MRRAELASLYHELGQLLRNGLTLTRAAEALARTPLPRASREWIEDLRRRTADGETFGSSLGGLPPLDRAVLSTAETSGHLDRALAILAEYHQGLDRVTGTVLRRAAYPAFLVHFGALVLALPRWVLGGGVGTYLTEVGSMLAGVYLTAAILYVGIRALVGSGRRSVFAERVMTSIPLLGPTLRNLAVSRFCLAYGMQLEAGLSVLRALPAAAEISGSARLRRAAQTALPAVERGGSPVPILAASLPEPVARGLTLGEETGTLDRELDRWAAIHREKALAGIDALGEWIPRLLYLAVAGLLAWKIVATYQQVLAGYAHALEC